MSTKVYTAYRLKHNRDLWPLLQDVRVKAQTKIRKVLIDLYLRKAERVDPTSEEYKTQVQLRSDPVVADIEARVFLTHVEVHKLFQQQFLFPYRDVYDFSVSIAIHPHKGRLYLLPYCDSLMRGVLGCLKQDDRVEDYAYWDNADPDGDVLPRAWAARGRVWDRICAHWDDMLVFEICTPALYHKVDPSVLVERKLLAEARKTRPR